MHICLLSLFGISDSLPHLGGVQTHTKKLVSLLLQKGCEVTLITSQGEGVRNGLLTVIPVGHVQKGRPDRKWFEKAEKAFLGVLAQKGVDCVFSEAGAVRGLMSLMSDCDMPVVTFTHSLSIHYFYNTWQEVDGIRALKSYVFRSLPRIIYDMFRMDMAFLRKCWKVVRGCVTISEQMKRLYRLPSDKLMVIHNWVDTDEFKHNERARCGIRKRWGLSDKDVVFLLVGSVWKPKGFRIALRSFRNFMRIVPNGYLIVAGDGPDRAYIERHTSRDHRLAEHVIMLGSRPHSELPSILSASDVFIIPSLMNEVLPYTLLEAMSCEMPVIASSIYANREALGDGGCFVTRRDVSGLTRAMLSFASDVGRRKADGVGNRRRALELFSTNAASKKINRLLEEVMSAKSR